MERVIVYRSQFEAQQDQWLMSGGYLTVLLIMIAAAIIIIAGSKIHELIRRRKRGNIKFNR